MLLRVVCMPDPDKTRIQIQNDTRSLSTRDHDRLLRKSLNNLGSPGPPHARGKFRESVGLLLLANGCELRGRGIALEQIEEGGMIQARAHYALERRMDLCQQPADAIAGCSDLPRQIIVEPTQHRELGDFVIGQLQRTQGVWHAASGLCDDVSVPRIGLGFTSMQVGNAAHRETGQVRNQCAFGASDSNRQCAHRGRLIDYEQYRTVLFELSDQRSQSRLIIGQSAVQKALSRAVQSNRMVVPLANVNTEDHLNVVMLLDVSHAYS